MAFGLFRRAAAEGRFGLQGRAIAARALKRGGAAVAPSLVTTNQPNPAAVDPSLINKRPNLY